MVNVLKLLESRKDKSMTEKFYPEDLTIALLEDGVKFYKSDAGKELVIKDKLNEADVLRRVISSLSYVLETELEE